MNPAAKTRTRPVHALTILFLCIAAVSLAIDLDGDLSDWTSIPRAPVFEQAPPTTGSLPSAIEPDPAPTDPLARVGSIKIAQDAHFLYVYMSFMKPRPLGRGPVDGAGRERPWDDMTYVEIDTDRDARWDYRTRMTQGKRSGWNNLMVVESVGIGEEGAVVLYPEGHKNYRFAGGPRAAFTRDSMAMEQRIPRAPLGLGGGEVNLRALVRLRERIDGKTVWRTRYYPAENAWFTLQLVPEQAFTGEGRAVHADPSLLRIAEYRLPGQNNAAGAPADPNAAFPPTADGDSSWTHSQPQDGEAVAADDFASAENAAEAESFSAVDDSASTGSHLNGIDSANLPEHLRAAGMYGSALTPGSASDTPDSTHPIAITDMTDDSGRIPPTQTIRGRLPGDHAPPDLQPARNQQSVMPTVPVESLDLTPSE